MATIIPTNSFIRPYSAPVDNCAEQIKLCLPVYDVNDIAFMFSSGPYQDGDVYVYRISLFKGNMMIGTTKDMLFESVCNGVTCTDYVYIDDISLMDFETEIDDGECFQLRISSIRLVHNGGVSVEPEVILFQTSCFQKISDPCWSSVIKYRCNENSFGLFYYLDDGAGNLIPNFYNKVRLPFYLKEPQFLTKRNVFVKSDGSRKKLSARIENEYECGTDYMPKDWHEKLVVALEHDEVLITNTNSGFTEQAFSQEGNYDIDWQKFLDYPTAPAKFKLFKTPYFNVNSNCT